MKEAERNARRELSRKNKKNKEDVKLLKALKSRKIKSMDFQLEKINLEKEDEVVEVLEKLTPILPAAFKKRVHFRYVRTLSM